MVAVAPVHVVDEDANVAGVGGSVGLAAQDVPVIVRSLVPGCTSFSF